MLQVIYHIYFIVCLVILIKIVLTGAYHAIMSIRHRTYPVPVLIAQVTSFLAITATMVLFIVTSGLGTVIVIPLTIFIIIQVWIITFVKKLTKALSCQMETANITMVTGKAEVEIVLAGSGEVRIDWGDGSKPESYAISESTTTCKHTRSGISARTIHIYGEKIMLFDCRHNQIKSLDVRNNTELSKLICCNNQLTALILINNPKLTILDCECNRLQFLTVSALRELYCGSNRLTSLNVNNDTALTKLYCDFNQLTDLDVSNNTALTILSCSVNQLKSLDVSNNAALTILSCDSNRLSVDGLSSLFDTLHSNTVSESNIHIDCNPGTDGCNRSIATAKGWTVVVD